MKKMNMQTNKENVTYDSILKQSSQNKKVVYKFSKIYPAFIILLLLILTSIFLYRIVDDRVKQDKQNNYDKAVESVMKRIETGYNSHVQVLGSMRGLYDYLVQVVRDYFILYGSIPTKTYSSIMSMMYVPRVDKKGLGEYVYYVKSQGYYDYQIHPFIEKNTYYPVEFLVPDTLNKHLIGLDLSTMEGFQDEIFRARDSNSLTATKVMNIRSGDTLSMYLISPVFKRGSIFVNETNKITFDGMVVLEINLPLMLKNALKQSTASDTSITFECIYQNYANKDIIVYRSSNFDQNKGAVKPSLTSQRKLKIAEEYLIVNFASVTGLDKSLQGLLPILTLVLSLIISFAIFAFFLSVITSRGRAVDLAERMTRSQRRIVESSKDIIAICDYTGVWKTMNIASIEIFGFEPKELIGEKIDNMFANDSYKKEFYNLMDITEEESQISIDSMIVDRFDTLKWLSWNITVSPSEKLLYCIGRDVTVERLAEEQERLKSKQIQLARQFTSEASESKSYFLAKLSHQLRDSLTSIIGYNQLLAEKFYDTEEEHDQFISIVNQSTEELFVFVSDMIEIAMQNTEEVYNQLSVIPFEKFKDLFTGILSEKIRDSFHNIKNYTIETEGVTQTTSIVANFELVSGAVLLCIQALSEFAESVDFTINIQVNPYESAAELQILSSSNDKVAGLIEIYKLNLNNLIDALKLDEKDVILHFGIAASMFRMINGNMKVETLGKEDGNLILITLPINRKIEQ